MNQETRLKRMESLTPKERKYFSIMWAKYGVLFIKARPGVAKSAIAASIADKMGFDYVDIRLSMVDETDVGLYPQVSEVEVDGDSVKCLDFVVPRWAIEANKRPTIIHFEELNRTTQQVRNAALQILLERRIGNDFKFNDNVLMLSSGNLGEDDGTDVEEFDAALNNRLVHINHDMGVDEWLENFANENVHNIITQFIKAHPEQLIIDPSDNTSAFATPRSWTMLSEFIVKNYGMKSSVNEFLPMVEEIAHGYIGNSAVKFLRYCRDMSNININHVLNDFDEIKEDLMNYNRDKKSELISSLKEIKFDSMSEKQFKNSIKFVDTISDEEKTAYFMFLLDEFRDQDDDLNDCRIREFMLTFRDLTDKILNINEG
jgi:hypothetical protein